MANLQIGSAEHAIRLTCPNCTGTIPVVSGPEESISSNISDPSSNALFARPYNWCLSEVAHREMITAANRDIGELDHLNDDRAVALVGGMLVEDEIDELLSAIMPGYPELEKNRDFTLSLKIALARAADLCPSRIFNDADHIRSIRNQFSHKLSVYSFADLPGNVVQSARDRTAAYASNEALETSPRNLFVSLVKHVTMALRTYRLHVAVLNAFLRNEGLTSQLEKFARSGPQEKTTG